MASKVCQSCAMPLMKEADHGTNADGSFNEEYCFHCYKDGKYIHDCNLDGMIEHVAQFLDEVNKFQEKPMTKEEFVQSLKTTLPNLKRWKN